MAATAGSSTRRSTGTAQHPPIDTDMVAMLFGPFGDLYRRDKRMPFVSEGYVDIHPLDARELGVADGDCVWIDADPSDRPFRGWKRPTPDYEVGTAHLRARYYRARREASRMWFNMCAATPGSVGGIKASADGLAKNPTPAIRPCSLGAHQAATRGWLKPTLDDTMRAQRALGPDDGTGFWRTRALPTGAPRDRSSRS